MASVTGISVAELAERVKCPQGCLAGWLSEWREAGWAECVDGGWRLTPAGLEIAHPTLDLRELGEDGPGEIKRLKRAVDSASLGVVKTVSRARRAGG